MNTQGTEEFAEWLRAQSVLWGEQADKWLAVPGSTPYQVGYARGAAHALQVAERTLADLTTPDSSSDLPSVKG